MCHRSKETHFGSERQKSTLIPYSVIQLQITLALLANSFVWELVNKLEMSRLRGVSQLWR